jgi:hypothetical protein
MADTKISNLPAVTTVADTDEYVLARSGGTKKITGANLKAGTASTGGATGAAGGVLAGTYPNPSFAADMATQAELNAVAATIPAGVTDLDDLTDVTAPSPADEDVLAWDTGAGAWRPFPVRQLVRRTIEVKVFDDATAVTTGDGKIIFCIPETLDGFDIVAANAFVTTVSSSGAPTVQIRNITQAADMLSTRITIDASEYTSYTAATPAVINNGDVDTGDLIAVDVDVAGTGAKGLGVILTLQLP